MTFSLSKEDNVLIEKMASFKSDFEGFVLYSYPWGQEGTFLEHESGPDVWQLKLLRAVDSGLSIKDALRFARASGHGIGKSAFVAWLCHWTLATCVDARGVVTANTESQLKTKTVPELSKWHSVFIAKHWFDLKATSLTSVIPERKLTWRIDFIPWSETNPEAFAGLHNKGKRVVLIMDESSAIADIIWETAEGAMTDTNTQLLWFAFGNPTRNVGRFKQCFTKFKHRWDCDNIDSRDSKFTDKVQISEWEKDYGANSDFFKVRVRGMFPSASSIQFISTDIVDGAFGRTCNESMYINQPKILVCEPAWTGDDALIIAVRQGVAFRILMRMEKNDDDTIVAGHLMRFEDEEDADAVFIDLGWGTGIYSVGKALNRSWQLVNFGGSSTDEGYLNKRAEMYGHMRTWLKDGGCIPADQELYNELIGPQYMVRLDGKIVLESKKDMKKRGIPSPNKADALALTFALPVTRKDRSIIKKKRTTLADYDVLS